MLSLRDPFRINPLYFGLYHPAPFVRKNAQAVASVAALAAELVFVAAALSVANAIGVAPAHLHFFVPHCPHGAHLQTNL